MRIVKLRVIVSLSFVLAVAACGQSEKFTVGQKAVELPATKTPDALKVEYELQERCGKSAQEYFKRKYGNGSVVTEDGREETSYANHYNKKLNKCFVTTTLHNYVYKGGQPEYAKSFFITLLDVNESKEYGRFFNIYPKDTPALCEIEDKRCASYAEWDATLKTYMEE